MAQSIEVAPGEQDIVVKLREVKLDVKLEVVHKHRMGSCSGQLVATPQGMRYETANKDDAFTTPLLDLETFEVDYLEKNLRIKPRQGKRYDFTDPEGNADHLFVFHRDVDKARERLKKGDPPAASVSRRAGAGGWAWGWRLRLPAAQPLSPAAARLQPQPAGPQPPAPSRRAVPPT